MHEMSLAVALLESALEEARKNGCNKLTRVKAEYGPLSGVMGEALDFCFHALIAGTIHEKASLELCKTPLRLRCGSCRAVFSAADQGALWRPCPECGQSLGHEIIEGRDLVLSRIEACRE